MDEERAREILKDWVQSDGSLFCLGHYISWPCCDKEEVCLDDTFTANELEAIAWWMRNK